MEKPKPRKCPTCGRCFRPRPKADESASVEIPAELRELELYAADKRLCQQWPRLVKSWKAAYPGLDIVGQVRLAHAWEMEHPERRKVRRDIFLGGWLRRNQDNPRVPKHIQNLASQEERERVELLGHIRRYVEAKVTDKEGEQWEVTHIGLLHQTRGITPWSRISLESLRRLGQRLGAGPSATSPQQQTRSAAEPGPSIGGKPNGGDSSASPSAGGARLRSGPASVSRLLDTGPIRRTLTTPPPA